MVNDKLCISVSGDKTMCRFDPDLLEEVAERKAFQPMIMKGKEYSILLCGTQWIPIKRYIEVLDYLCLSFKERAKSSTKLLTIVPEFKLRNSHFCSFTQTCQLRSAFLTRLK